MGAAIPVWIVLGAIAGLIVNKLANKRGEAASLEIVLGIVGAVIGGWLFSRFAAAAATGFNVRSILFAAVGAAVALIGWYTIRGSTSRA
jgi:uncharacterized membrane protein YeaQ/YmgE (transglycosylase-associated protein family)